MIDYDKINEWEQNNYEDLIEGFIEKHQELWADYVLDRFETAHQE